MKENPDFRDLLYEFNAGGVDYLIVGAHALAAHGVRAGPKTLRVARAAIHHRQRACSSVKYTQYSPLLAHPLAARLAALARSEVLDRL
ncbi:MAG: hypothetical protein MJE77_39310 [Proteobacteria bacterium]|nr:hypothetical protein [Pseudomonadota bacterium]